MNKLKNLRLLKNTAIAIAAVMAVTMLNGCGKEKKKELGELTDNFQDESEQSLKDKLGVPDGSVTYDYGDSQVDVAVDFPECSKVGVYELEQVSLTSEYMTQMAESIFDEGEYEIVWPCYIMTEEQLMEGFEEKGEIITSSGIDDGGYLSYFVFWDWCMYSNELDAHNTETEIENPGDVLTMYYRDANGYSYVCADGTINGENYRLTFSYDAEIHIELAKERNADDYYNEYSEEYVDLLSMDKDIIYTEQEACDMAYSIIEKMGLSGTEFVDRLYILEESEEINGPLYVNGYKMIYGLGQDDVSMLYDRYSDLAGYIYLYIGNDGLIEMSVNMPYNILSCMEEDTELLSFSQIEEISKPILKEHELTGAVDKITFGYVVADYEGKDVLLPVWGFIGWADTDNETLFIMLNAIDGSVVEPESSASSAVNININ